MARIFTQQTTAGLQLSKLDSDAHKSINSWKMYITFKNWLVFLCFLSPLTLYAFEINDGHIHYNQDVWSRLSAERVMKYLAENEIQRAIVSSTPTEGTEKLYKLAPDRVIPFLRPYRNIRDEFTFHSDPTILNHLKQKIDLGIYTGIGEFHLFEEHKDTAVVKEIMQLAADYKLAISAHSDYATILTLVNLQPDVRIIWAHCGMYHPVADIKHALEQYPNLFCDLSFRYNMFDKDEQLRPEWKTLLEKNSTRFILGMDTYVPRRWAALPEHVAFAHSWLEQLSQNAQQNIARENINNWF